CRFDIELSGLREVSLLVEIIDREKCRCALARRRRQDRRIGERESPIIEEVTTSFDDLSADAQNRRLARCSHPEVAMVHQNIDAVFFQRNWEWLIVWNTLNDLHVRNIQLVTTGGALVGSHFTFDDHARFLREILNRIEHFRSDCVLRNYPLDRARAVAKNREQQLTALAQVVEPPADRDRMTVVPANFGNCSDGRRHLKTISPQRTPRSARKTGRKTRR